MHPRLRALVLLAVVLDVPLLSRAACALTRRPRPETAEIDGVPVEVIRPGRGGPWPAWVFVNGAHPLRRREPVVTRLAHGLARAGYLVVVPDLPGLGEGRITARTLEATVAVTRAAADRADVREGRVALIGASTGAGLALLVAGRSEVADRVSTVAAVAPYADLEKMVCLATTCWYEEEGALVRYAVTDLHRRVVAGSLVATLPPGDDRERLFAELERLEGEDEDPLEHLPLLAEEVGPEAQAVLRVLGNRDPHRFAELLRELPPDALELVHTLSPIRCGHNVRAPVEIVVPPVDEYFPLGEAKALATAFPDVRLTVTRTLDHTRPTPTLRALRDFVDFDRFVVRGLAQAAA